MWSQPKRVWLIDANNHFDFDGLNESIFEELADLNSQPFQKKAGSRDERLKDAKRAALQPPPKYYAA